MNKKVWDRVFNIEEEHPYVLIGKKSSNMVEVKIKLDEGATMPTQANSSDSGYDLVATSVRYDEEGDFLEYGTGVYLDIPEGYHVLLHARSSVSKYDLVLANGVGLVDQTYNKELLLRFKVVFDYDCAIIVGDELKTYDTTNRVKPHIRYAEIYKVGDKIAQMVIEKKTEAKLTQVDELVDSGRSGFGSTDRPYAKYNE